MSKDQIKREIKKLKRTIDTQPRILSFRGKRVVHSSQWKWGDWTKLPDKYSLLIIWGKNVPADYYEDYAALLEKLGDPAYGRHRCWDCAIHLAQYAKKEIDRHDKYWRENGGEAAREEWYHEVNKAREIDFRRQDAMRVVEWRIYNELAEAKNRTCEVINYFRCPYPDDREELQHNGVYAVLLWREIKWYDYHWNSHSSYMPPASEMKWYHFNEPPIIDVTNYDDIVQAIDDGRLDRIIDEHLRYMKETNRKNWAL